MGRALLIVGWLATLGLCATAVLGYLANGDAQRFGTHLMLGLISVLLLMFSHSWIMFYLIGTGKAIKEAVAEHALDNDFIERTKEFKNRSYPPLMLATGVAMATFILGGGVATSVIPRWTHQTLFFATLFCQVRALWIETSVLGDNERLMGSISNRIDGA